MSYTNIQDAESLWSDEGDNLEPKDANNINIPTGKTYKINDVPLSASDVGAIGLNTTDTLTNKRITERVVTATNDATAVIDSDSYDEYYLTAMEEATTISITGTPTAGQMVFIGLKDDNDAGGYALTWTGITALGITLPATTTANKQTIVGVKYIASAWRAIAIGVESA